MPDNAEVYIRDLLDRLDNNDHSPNASASSESIRDLAHREAEKLSSLELLPAIRECIRKAKKIRCFHKLAIILGGLIRNTRNSDALLAFSQLMEKAPNKDGAWNWILKEARKSRIESAKPYALRIIAKPLKPFMAFDSAIEYLGTMGGAEEVSLIGNLLDNDCEGGGDPLYCVWALKEIGHPDAIPYLRRALDRHAKSRKGLAQDIRHFAPYAIEAIKYGPPELINGLSIDMWSVPPDVPERIAIGLKGDNVFLLVCDSQWTILEAHSAADCTDAQNQSLKISGCKYLYWHPISTVS